MRGTGTPGLFPRTSYMTRRRISRRATVSLGSEASDRGCAHRPGRFHLQEHDVRRWAGGQSDDRQISLSCMARRIICDAAVTIGEYALISWNVVLDGQLSRAVRPGRPATAAGAGERHRSRQSHGPARSSHGRSVSIAMSGLDSRRASFPGVTIGEGAIVGARSVVDGRCCAFHASLPAIRHV